MSQAATHFPEWVSSTISGVGIGLRMQHIEMVLTETPDIPWFELLADNHIAEGGIIPRQLEMLRTNYPITLHSVGMSLAGTDPLDFNYLATLRRLHRHYEAAWISDHLCFSQHNLHQHHELLPFPYTEEALLHVAERVTQIQDFFNAPLLIENVSSYLSFNDSTMSEAEFMANLCERTDCKVLLDVNNIYVNKFNNDSSPEEWLTLLKKDQIGEIHLAGYEDRGDYLLDAHNNKVSNEVWKLYQQTTYKFGEIPTLIEWDNDIPSFSTLVSEANKAQKIMQRNETDVA